MSVCRRRLAAHLAGALIVSLTALAGESPSVAAEGSNNIGLTGFGDLVVDEPHGHIFISQPSGGLLVADLDGERVATLPGFDDARGMTLDDDGSTLYVALRTGEKIAAVDTTTLAVTEHPVGAGICPVSVAVTSGVVWFGHSCHNAEGGIGSLDPVTGTVREDVIGRGSYNPLVATSPALPGTVIVSERGLSPASLWAYDVSTSPVPTLTQRAYRWNIGSGLNEIAFFPDGSRMITASNNPPGHQVFLTSDLSPAGTYDYETSSAPTAAAVRADGMVAAGVTQGRNIFLYKAGSSTLYRTYELGTTSSRELLAGGLAFGSERLYAVAGDVHYQYAYRLYVIIPRDPSVVGVDVGRKSVKYGTRVTATLSLDTPSPKREVVLYATVPGTDQREKLAVREVGPEGATVTFTARKNWRLDAVYAGDEVTDSGIGSTTLKVAATAKAKVLNAVQQSYGTAYLHSGDTAMVLAKVKASAPCARFRIEVEKMGRFRELDETRCLALGSTGRIRLALHSRPRTGYYKLRVAAYVAKGRYNTFGSSRWREIQFCVGAIPCGPGGRPSIS